MILNLNKDFFLGALIWYLLITGTLGLFLSLICEERPKTYSAPDNFVVAIICLGWVLS